MAGLMIFVSVIQNGTWPHANVNIAPANNQLTTWFVMTV